MRPNSSSKCALSAAALTVFRRGCLFLVTTLYCSWAYAQVSYSPHDVSSPAPEGSFLVPVGGSTCSLPHSGYMKQGDTLRTNASGSVAGYCDWLWNGSVMMTETRWLSHHKVTRTPPTGSAGSAFFWAPYHVQQYDSSTVQSGYATFSMTLEGKHIFDFMSVGTATNCAIPTNSPVSTKLVNVLACKPIWYEAGNPLKTVHFPTTQIKVYIPSGSALRDALVTEGGGGASEAVDLLNNMLDGTGVSFDIVDTDCGSGADCVKVSSSSAVSGGCADFTPTNINVSTGEINAYSNLRLKEAYWPNATAARLQRTMAHELLHGLGLNHKESTCSLTASLMSTTYPPGTTEEQACTSDTGMAVSPTPSDIIPTVTSTYGNQVKTTCGF